MLVAEHAIDLLGLESRIGEGVSRSLNGKTQRRTSRFLVASTLADADDRIFISDHSRSSLRYLRTLPKLGDRDRPKHRPRRSANAKRKTDEAELIDLFRRKLLHRDKLDDVNTLFDEELRMHGERIMWVD